MTRSLFMKSRCGELCATVPVGLLALLALGGEAVAGAEAGGTNTATRADGAASSPASTVFRNLSPGSGSARAYFVSAAVEFRMLAVTDVDPANDRALLYSVKGGYELIPRGVAFASLGLTQAFVAEEGESGFRFQDMQAGFDYSHDVGLGALGAADRQINFAHRLSFYLPTSRESQAQDLYVAPQALSRARMTLIDRLVVGLDGSFQYRFHQFAERAGLGGGLNTQLVLRGLALVEYTPVDRPDVGTITIGIDATTSWFKKYRSRDDHASGTSSAALWLQDYGWDAYAVYAPLPYLWASVSLQQGGHVLRDGIVNTFFVHRDESEIVFSLAGRY